MIPLACNLLLTFSTKTEEPVKSQGQGLDGPGKLATGDNSKRMGVESLGEEGSRKEERSLVGEKEKRRDQKIREERRDADKSGGRGGCSL